MHAAPSKMLAAVNAANEARAVPRARPDRGATAPIVDPVMFVSVRTRNTFLSRTTVRAEERTGRCARRPTRFDYSAALASSMSSVSPLAGMA